MFTDKECYQNPENRALLESINQAVKGIEVWAEERQLQDTGLNNQTNNIKILFKDIQVLYVALSVKPERHETRGSQRKGPNSNSKLCYLAILMRYKILCLLNQAGSSWFEVSFGANHLLLFSRAILTDTDLPFYFPQCMEVAVNNKLWDCRVSVEESLCVYA